MRDPKATDQARWGFVVILVLVTIFLFVAQQVKAQTKYWSAPPEIAYSSEVPTEWLPLIDYAAWSVSERSGLPLTVVGERSGVNHYRIYIDIVTTAEALAEGAKATGKAYVKRQLWASNLETMATAHLRIRDNMIGRPQSEVQHMLVHEMMHAVGIRWHSPRPMDIMYKSAPSYVDMRYTLTAYDVGLLHPHYDTDLCYAELTPELDIYNTSIGNYGAELVYQCAEVWTLGDAEAVIGSCGGSIVGNVVTMPDIRSEDGWRYSATFIKDGITVTLDSLSVTGQSQMMSVGKYMNHGAVVDGGIIHD